MVATVATSAALVGARKHTAWNTLVTWHWAKAVADSSSVPSDLAPLPLPGSDGLQPSEALMPPRQRLDQLSLGVTKPNGKLVELIRYFGCTWFCVYCIVPVFMTAPRVPLKL